MEERKEKIRCPHCRIETPGYGIYCIWCGERIVKPKKQRPLATPVPVPVQLPSGRWSGQLMVKGKRIRVTEDTEREYYAKARAMKDGLILAANTAPRMTVGEAVDAFIESRDAVLSPATIRAYKSYRKNHFQAVMAKDIHGTIDWQRAVNDEAKTTKGKTLSNAWHLILSALTAQGVEAPAATLPRVVRASRPWLDYEQIQTFLAAVKGKDCELAALLALHGLRRSELLALTADKVDLKKKTIRVEGAAVFNSDGELVDKAENKSDKSRRVVHIEIPRLEDLVKGKAGKLVTKKPGAIYYEINKVCEAAGLPTVGIHGLRHSFASLCHHLGWSIEATKREGGWSTSRTVQEIYTHLAAQDLDDAVVKMREFYEGKKRA